MGKVFYLFIYLSSAFLDCLLGSDRNIYYRVCNIIISSWGHMVEVVGGESIIILDRSRLWGREMEMAFSWATCCEEGSLTPRDWLFLLASRQGLGQGTMSAKGFLIRKGAFICFMLGREWAKDAKSSSKSRWGGSWYCFAIQVPPASVRQP